MPAEARHIVPSMHFFTGNGKNTARQKGDASAFPPLVWRMRRMTGTACYVWNSDSTAAVGRGGPLQQQGSRVKTTSLKAKGRRRHYCPRQVSTVGVWHRLVLSCQTGFRRRSFFMGLQEGAEPFKRKIHSAFVVQIVFDRQTNSILTEDQVTFTLAEQRAAVYTT